MFTLRYFSYKTDFSNILRCRLCPLNEQGCDGYCRVSGVSSCRKHDVLHHICNLMCDNCWYNTKAVGGRMKGVFQILL